MSKRGGTEKATSAKWREGFRTSIPAELAFAEVKSIHHDLGVVKPGDVVDRARPRRNPLHPHFEWDDSIAAEKHRKEQARHLLRNLVIVVIEEEKEREFSPAFVSVVVSGEGAEKERGYVSIATALSDDEMRKRALDDALAMLNGLRRRYSALQRFIEVLGEIESILLSEFE